MVAEFEDIVQKVPDPKHQEIYRNLLQWIADEFPELSRQVKWNQPMFVLDKTYIFSISTAKAHMSLSPEPQVLERFHERIEKAGYTYGSMLFRIKWNQEINYQLLKDMINVQIEEKRGSEKFWR